MAACPSTRGRYSNLKFALTSVPSKLTRILKLLVRDLRALGVRIVSVPLFSRRVEPLSNSMEITSAISLRALRPV
eukprot:2011824-Rhodomonas_salina.1